MNPSGKRVSLWVQLFTVHNPTALDGLPLGDDRVRLFAVDRNSEGHTVVKRIVLDDALRDLAERIVLDDALRDLAEREGLPLSRLWVLGHLGGVPNV